MAFPQPDDARRVFPFLVLAALALAAIPAARAGEEVLLRARLVAEDGTPIVGEYVTLCEVGTGGGCRVETTLSTGPGGRVGVRVSRDVQALLVFSERAGIAEVPLSCPAGDGPCDIGEVRLERKWVLRLVAHRGKTPVPFFAWAWPEEREGPDVSADARSGPDGILELALPRPGRWRIEVAAVADEEEAIRRLFLAGRGSPDVTVRARVPEGPLPVLVEVPVTVPTGSIAGTILDERGTPVDGANVFARNGEGIVRYGRSREDGTFACDTLPDGSWTLEVFRHGFVPFRREGVRVSDGTEARVDVRLAAASSFRLVPLDREEGKPAPAPVVLPLGPGEPAPRWPRQWFRAGRDGAIVDGLPPGRHVVAAWDLRPGVALVEVSLPVPPRTAVSFRWPRTQAVRLAVTRPDGSPAEGVLLAALRAQGGPDLLPVLRATRGWLCCGSRFREGSPPGTIFLPPLPPGCYRARLELDGKRWTVPFCLGPPGTPGARPAEHRVTCGDLLPVMEVPVVVGVPGPEPGPGPLPSPVRPAELVPPDAAKEPATRSR